MASIWAIFNILETSWEMLVPEKNRIPTLCKNSFVRVYFIESTWYLRENIGKILPSRRGMDNIYAFLMNILKFLLYVEGIFKRKSSILGQETDVNYKLLIFERFGQLHKSSLGLKNKRFYTIVTKWVMWCTFLHIYS